MAEFLICQWLTYLLSLCVHGDLAFSPMYWHIAHLIEPFVGWMYKEGSMKLSFQNSYIIYGFGYLFRSLKVLDSSNNGSFLYFVSSWGQESMRGLCFRMPLGASPWTNPGGRVTMCYSWLKRGENSGQIEIITLNLCLSTTAALHRLYVISSLLNVRSIWTFLYLLALYLAHLLQVWKNSFSAIQNLKPSDDFSLRISTHSAKSFQKFIFFWQNSFGVALRFLDNATICTLLEPGIGSSPW